MKTLSILKPYVAGAALVSLLLAVSSFSTSVATESSEPNVRFTSINNGGNDLDKLKSTLWDVYAPDGTLLHTDTRHTWDVYLPPLGVKDCYRATAKKGGVERERTFCVVSSSQTTLVSISF